MCPAQSRPQHHPGLLRLCPPTPFSSFSLANGYKAYSYWASSGQDNHPVASLLASLAHWRDLDNDSCTSTSTSLMPRPGEIELKENTYLNHTHTYTHTHLHSAVGPESKSRILWVQIPVLLLMSFVILGKSLYLSEPHFLHLQNGDDNPETFPCRIAGGFNETMVMKTFGSVNVPCSIKLLFLFPFSRRKSKWKLPKFQKNLCLGA